MTEVILYSLKAAHTRGWKVLGSRSNQKKGEEQPGAPSTLSNETTLERPGESGCASSCRFRLPSQDILYRRITPLSIKYNSNPQDTCNKNILEKLDIWRCVLPPPQRHGSPCNAGQGGGTGPSFIPRIRWRQGWDLGMTHRK